VERVVTEKLLKGWRKSQNYSPIPDRTPHVRCQQALATRGLARDRRSLKQVGRNAEFTHGRSEKVDCVLGKISQGTETEGAFKTLGQMVRDAHFKRSQRFKAYQTASNKMRSQQRPLKRSNLRLSNGRLTRNSTSPW